MLLFALLLSYAEPAQVSKSTGPRSRSQGTDGFKLLARNPAEHPSRVRVSVWV